MKDFLQFILGFTPWIAFGILAGPSFVSLETAIVVGLVLAVVTSLSQLRKGFFLAWGTLLFFMVTAIMVIGLKNIWFMQHLSVLVPTSMAAIAWLSLLAGKPFVLQIARESVPMEHWNDAGFIANCRHLTIVWGFLFLVSLAVSLCQFLHAGGPEWLYQTISTGSVLGGMAYTQWFKNRLKRQRARNDRGQAGGN